MQYGFYHNNNECIGCKTCIIACKDKNDLPVGEKFRRVYDIGGGSWEVDANGAYIAKDVFAYSASVACMHCAAPACVAVCPTGAMTKDAETGIVSNDQDVCIGCGSCANACPYSAPYVSTITKTSRKCDLCRDLIAKGETPVCVASCPLRCLNYGELDGLKSTYGTVQHVQPLADNTGTNPSVVFTPSRFNPTGTLPGIILNAPEEIASATAEV